jgi:hypothetical protein
VSLVTPIWGGDVVEPEVKYFYGRWMKSGTKINWSKADAKAMGLVCTDAESYAQSELYLREMKKLAEKRCK